MQYCRLMYEVLLVGTTYRFCSLLTLAIINYCQRNLSALLNAGNLTTINQQIGGQAVFNCLPGCVPLGGMAGPTFTCVGGNNISGNWSGPVGICSSTLFKILTLNEIII